MKDFEDLVLQRRSVYGIGGGIPVDDTALREELGSILLHMPTAYNMRGTRLVLLLAKDHKKLWDIVLEAIRKKATKGVSDTTLAKIAGFAAGHGTLLFFNDEDVTQQFMEENPAYGQNFPPWALQHNGMLQYALWAALAEKGIGASLQHYNPIIDDEVKRVWHLPARWQLLAQMPFGAVTQAPGPKERGTLEGRFLVFEGM